MSQPLRLYELQKIDSQLDRARARLAEIEFALNNNETLAIARQQQEAALASQHTAQTALKNAEAEVAAQQQKIANNQRALYGGSVTNPKELEDLQLEAEALQRQLTRLEETQLEAMLTFEERDQILTEAEQNIEATRARVAGENQDMHAEEKTLLAEAEKLEQARTTVLEDISADMLTLYQELRRTRKGLAVIAIQDAECPACGATLSSAQAQATRSPNQLATCAECGRIMVTA